jgi:hypothetical protein
MRGLDAGIFVSMTEAPLGPEALFIVTRGMVNANMLGCLQFDLAINRLVNGRHEIRKQAIPLKSVVNAPWHTNA